MASHDTFGAVGLFAEARHDDLWLMFVYAIAVHKVCSTSKLSINFGTLPNSSASTETLSKRASTANSGITPEESVLKVCIDLPCLRPNNLYATKYNNTSGQFDFSTLGPPRGEGSMRGYKEFVRTGIRSLTYRLSSTDLKPHLLHY